MTELRQDGGTASLVSSWQAADSSKHTTIAYPGDVEVRLDHTAMTGLLLVGGRVAEHRGYTGRVSRKVAHYQGLYDDVLGPQPSRFSGVELAAQVTRLLEEAGSAASSTPPWSGSAPRERDVAGYAG